MEESMSTSGGPAEQIREAFGLKKQDIRSYSPLTFAYIGDDVYDLIIRTLLVEQGNRSPEVFHQKASKLVKAGAQAKLIEALKEDLTGEESDVLRRGMNAKPKNKAKNATQEDYQKATACEALMGWLYLTDQMPRAINLVKTGLEKANLF
ncbi:MAG: ribonuclease III [Lachnospiraceae bacterium]|nr:ribonuclease III [Lachnospiraceae bacterium]